MDIGKIYTVLGEKRIDVKQKYPDAQRLIEKTGIPFVYETSGTTLDLVMSVVKEIPKNELIGTQLCLLVTQSPDDYLPAASIQIATKLGLQNQCLPIDITQGCSGFVQALYLVDSLVNKYKKVLLITADRYRSKLKEEDRSTNAVFSDGAAAMIISQGKRYYIGYEDHLNDGTKRSLLYQSTQTAENGGFLFMDGAKVWMFTTTRVVPQIKKTIQYCSENQLDIEYIYLHQASKIVVEGISKALQINENLIVKNYERTGNTVSSSIPFLLKDYPMQKSRKASIFAGFGVGLTSSVIVIRQ